MNYIYIIKSKVKFNQGSSARFLPDRRFPTTKSIERLIKNVTENYTTCNPKVNEELSFAVPYKLL